MGSCPCAPILTNLSFVNTLYPIPAIHYNRYMFKYTVNELVHVHCTLTIPQHCTVQCTCTCTYTYLVPQCLLCLSQFLSELLVLSEGLHQLSLEVV